MPPAMPGARGAIAAYARVDVETGVTAADPHKLILMLFDGALLCIASARQHMSSPDRTAEKGENISRAIDIISNGLKASLNQDAGGDLAVRLAALYDYMAQRLLYANLKNSVAALDEVHGLLAEIKDAWKQIGDKAPAAA